MTRSFRRQQETFRKLKKEWNGVNRDYLWRVIKEFKHDRLVDYQEESNGYIKIILTEEGKKRILSYKIDTLSITQQKQWDGLWRLVCFDIPEKKRRRRDALRIKLKESGFFEWQKSVFIYPYPCRDQIDFVVEFFGLRQHVRYGELLDPTNEAELKLHFNI